MRILILATAVVVGFVAGWSQVSGETLAYQAPAQNYHQNNWMNG